jgi:hypothetical protein
MKIDKRKKYLITLDVETTNNQIGVKNAPNDGLVYDIGFVVHDKQGNIYAKRSFAIKEIITDKILMDSAYYKKKLPIYWERIAQGQMKLISIWDARKSIKTAMELFNITEVYAFNANFDYTTLNNTVRYISGSSCRWFFKYGTKICDIWHIACQVLGLQKTFQWENVRNTNGNLITNAERMFGYCEQIDFQEEHTGLADAIVESQILARCFASHKHIDKNINRACWRIPQTKVA